MSTGFQGKFHRQNILSRLAKDLVRRSRSHCELCDRNGIKLEVFELPPAEEEPTSMDASLSATRVRKQIERRKK